jgi:hypothetical protein
METPLITFAPTAVTTIITCQQILFEFASDRSAAGDAVCVDLLLKTLHDDGLIFKMKEAGFSEGFGQIKL